MPHYINDIISKIAAGVLTISVLVGVFGLGSRGTEELYQDKFRYQGEKVIIKHEDIRLKRDKYWIEFKNVKIYSGNIEADEGYILDVKGNRFTLR